MESLVGGCVVYHGRRCWTAPLSLSGLFRGPPALDAFRPELRYVLLDLQAWKQEEIIGGLLLRVTLLVLHAIFRVRLQCVLEAARHGTGLDDVQLAIQG